MTSLNNISLSVMRIILNKILPVGKKYGAINLFGVVFAKPDMRLTPEVLNHEKIHTAQMRELGYVLFYIAYVVEWLYQLARLRGDTFGAYREILFEREAYAHGDDLLYLDSRRHFAQGRRQRSD